MNSVYLKEDSYDDIDMLDEYNREYLEKYPDFEPFVTRDNYSEVLKNNELLKKGIGNDGIKEVFYWAIENNKIIGHASVRLNPEDNPSVLKYSGHIMYGVVPSKRNLGYGSIICHLLIKEMDKLGYTDIIVTCSDDNLSSIRVIEKNFGKLIETVEPDNYYVSSKTRRYKINVKESLNSYNKKYENSDEKNIKIMI